MTHVGRKSFGPSLAFQNKMRAMMKSCALAANSFIQPFFWRKPWTSCPETPEQLADCQLTSPRGTRNIELTPIQIETAQMHPGLGFFLPWDVWINRLDIILMKTLFQSFSVYHSKQISFVFSVFWWMSRVFHHYKLELQSKRSDKRINVQGSVWMFNVRLHFLFSHIRYTVNIYTE